LLHRDEYVSINASAHGLFVTTSLSREIGTGVAPNVRPPASQTELERRFEALQVHLASLGVYIDVTEAALSRVDLHKDVRVTGGYGDYGEVMQLCDLQRLSPTELRRVAPFGEKIDERSRMVTGAHTYGRTLKSRAVVAYSKLSHLRTQNAHREYARRVSTGLDGDDIIRFEARYLRAAAVRRGLNVATGADLIASCDRLPERMSGVVDSTILASADGDNPSVRAGLGLTERVRALAQTNGPGKKTALLAMAAGYLELTAGGAHDLEYVRAVLSDAGMRKRDIDGLLVDLAPAMCRSGTRSIADRLTSLRNSLHGPSYAWPAA
jgi:hypothetical protein